MIRIEQVHRRPARHHDAANLAQGSVGEEAGHVSDGSTHHAPPSQFLGSETLSRCYSPGPTHPACRVPQALTKPTSRNDVVSVTSDTVAGMELGYARVSTAKQDLERQIDALTATGIAPEKIFVDKKSGAHTDRPGLTALLDYARTDDVIVVHTLDRLGRTVRDTLNLIHDLTERGIGLRNLADPIKINSANPDDPMGQLALVLLALFAQMERTYMLERAAHARSVAARNGRRTGRPSVVDPDKLTYAIHLRDTEALTMAEIATKTGITRATLYRHLPPRPPEPITAAGELEPRR